MAGEITTINDEEITKINDGLKASKELLLLYYYYYYYYSTFIVFTIFTNWFNINLIGFIGSLQTLIIYFSNTVYNSF